MRDDHFWFSQRFQFRDNAFSITRFGWDGVGGAAPSTTVTFLKGTIGLTWWAEKMVKFSGKVIKLNGDAFIISPFFAFCPGIFNETTFLLICEPRQKGNVFISLFLI